MKHAKKVWDTSVIGRRDPYIELTRQTPEIVPSNPTTDKSPAELLFARKFRTKLQDLRTNPAMTRQEKEAREQTGRRRPG